MRGDIDKSASKGDNEDDTDSWYEQNFDEGGGGGGDRLGNDERDEKNNK